jgi:hypothetical protein
MSFVSTSVPSNKKDHPVWELYDEIRTARLNVKGLQHELKWLRRKSITLDVIIATSGASSIGGLWFLQNGIGATLWRSLGVVAIVCAVVKPFLPYTENRITNARLLTSYRVLEHDLHCISVGVKERKHYDDQAKAEFRTAMMRKEELVKQTEGTCPRKQVILKLWAEINNELPEGGFYIPKETA